MFIFKTVCCITLTVCMAITYAHDQRKIIFCKFNIHKIKDSTSYFLKNITLPWTFIQFTNILMSKLSAPSPARLSNFYSQQNQPTPHLSISLSQDVSKKQTDGPGWARCTEFAHLYLASSMAQTWSYRLGVYFLWTQIMIIVIFLIHLLFIHKTRGIT